ncbi:MAG TPA: DNA polymerase IV, partial [Treponemataceae bacterium]|nr:DNA polymerase IV [Treponemataceae bacterium]
MSAQELFFHVDLDAFFASVEQLDNQALRGKPVIVGGDPSKRGVVSTCSYEARTFGVHSAMPMAQALRLCPQAIVVQGRMRRYHDKSREVMHIFSSFSPDVQQISVDEAFLDMSGTERLFGNAEKSARELKKRVTEETGLTVSVGAAPNRYVAKIASALSKPNGLVIVQPGEEEAFMLSLRLKDVWGVGEKSRERLIKAGLSTVTLIHDTPEPLLRALFGDALSAFLFQAVRGIDPGILSGETANRSISAEHTFAHDIRDRNIVETLLLELSQELSFRLLDEDLSARTVTVKIRYDDFRTVSIQETLKQDIIDSAELFERARLLFRKKDEREKEIRLIGLGLSHVQDRGATEQLDLFPDKAQKKREQVEKALHALTKKRGKRMVTRARLIGGDRREQ